MTQLAERTAAPLARVDASIMESVIVAGDLAQLSPAERVSYYMKVCESVGLNPLSKPFDYIKLNGKLTLYALKTTTDQLRQIHGVSIVSTEKELLGEVYLVTAHARTSDGREDSDIGAVTVKGLQGENLANAYMKALTKAKRRVTLSICGLGWLDETEVGSIPTAQAAEVDVRTGEIKSAQPIQQTRTVDVTREVAQAAGVQPQQAAPARSEALIAWEEKIGKVGTRLTELGLRDQARAVMGQHPNWKTDIAAASAVYAALKQIGERHAEELAARTAQEDNLPSQVAQALDIDEGLEPVQADTMISPERLKALQTAYGTRMKLSTPEDRHEFAQWFLSLPEPLASTKHLTETQAETLMDTIGGWDDDTITQSLTEFRKWQGEKAPF